MITRKFLLVVGGGFVILCIAAFFLVWYLVHLDRIITHHG
jgi:hypothetical protein